MRGIQLYSLLIGSIIYPDATKECRKGYVLFSEGIYLNPLAIELGILNDSTYGYPMAYALNDDTLVSLSPLGGSYNYFKSFELEAAGPYNSRANSYVDGLSNTRKIKNEVTSLKCTLLVMASWSSADLMMNVPGNFEVYIPSINELSEYYKSITEGDMKKDLDIVTRREIDKDYHMMKVTYSKILNLKMSSKIEVCSEVMLSSTKMAGLYEDPFVLKEGTNGVDVIKASETGGYGYSLKVIPFINVQ